MRTQDEIKKLFIEDKNLGFYAFNMEDLVCLLELTKEEQKAHKDFL